MRWSACSLARFTKPLGACGRHLLWLHLPKLPPICPFPAMLNPSPFFRGIYKFTPLLRKPSSPPCPNPYIAFLLILKDKLRFLFSKVVPEPPKGSYESLVCMDFLSSVPVFTLSPDASYLIAGRLILLPVHKPPMASCHVQNKIQTRLYVIKPLLSDLICHSQDSSHTCFLLFVGTFHTYSQYPRPHPRARWFSGKTHRIQHIVVFTAMIYYRKRVQSKISKGNGAWGESGGRHMQTCKGLLPEESHGMCLIYPAKSCDNTCEMSTRETP